MSTLIALCLGCSPADPIDLENGQSVDAMSDSGNPEDGTLPTMDSETPLDSGAEADAGCEEDGGCPDSVVDAGPEPSDAEIADTGVSGCTDDEECAEGSNCEVVAACSGQPACYGSFGEPCEMVCDCGGSLLCNASTQQCAECLNDANCSPRVCMDGRCIDGP